MRYIVLSIVALSISLMALAGADAQTSHYTDGVVGQFDSGDMLLDSATVRMDSTGPGRTSAPARDDTACQASASRCLLTSSAVAKDIMLAETNASIIRMIDFIFIFRFCPPSQFYCQAGVKGL